MTTPTLQIQIDNAHHTRIVERETRTLVGPVSLEIKAGEFLSIVGPVGCGKTILLKMIAGILPVSGGAIRIVGAKLEPPSRDFGLVLQEPALLPWRTSMQNILLQAEMRSLNLEQSRNRARRLLAWFGLSRFEESKPHELLPGTSQAISICRALVHGPSLLLLDEPFRTLDPLSLEPMLDAFQRLWAETGTTALLFTRNLHEAVLLSDRVAVMSPRPGRISGIIPVDLPRPRRLDRAMTPQIAEYGSRIRTLFRAQGVLP
jgi:NitT/TauT family transport system ATP-binding protein